MAEGNKIRLIKIASEINIGRETIVEYLKTKGHVIDNKPTALLSDEMVNIVYDKFKREKKAAEKQREKVQKHKEIRKHSDPKAKTSIDDDFEDDEPSVDIPKPKVKLADAISIESVQIAEEKSEPKQEPQVVKSHDAPRPAEIATTDVVAKKEVEAQPIQQQIKREDAIAPKEAVEKIRENKDKPAPKEQLTPQKEVAKEVKFSEPQVGQVIDLSPKKKEPSKDAQKGEQRQAQDNRNKKRGGRNRNKKQQDRQSSDSPLAQQLSQANIKPAEKRTFPERDSRRQQSDRQQSDRQQSDRQQSDRQQSDRRSDAQQQGKHFERQKPAEQQHKQPAAYKPSSESELAKRLNEELKQKALLNEEQKQLTPEEIAAANERRDKKRKRKKKLIEVVEPGQMPKLSGLKILGKIEIGKEKPPVDKNKFVKKVKGKFEQAAPLVDDALDADKNKFRKKKKGKDGVADEIDTQSKSKDKLVDKKRKKRRKSIRESISAEDVEKAIRETYAGMEYHGAGSSRSKIKQKKKTEREEKELRILEEKERDSHILKLTEFVTTSDLANLMNRPANEIILKCMSLGLMVTINQRLDKDTITLIADDYGFTVEFLDQQSVVFVEDFDDPADTLVARSPIVTIMGHVDHGKTSLLDYIRSSNVVAGEAGGITQHIGAYKVELPNNKSITFLDTPGHEAFTAMRARGAQVTDIVVLVVAADDSVMPQTIEAISHAKAANVPIVVAINKIDKPDANPDRIKQQLSDHGVLIEDWGGKYQNVMISAKKGMNIDLLLEKIILEADLLNLKANPERYARGIVIESNMSKGLGSVATVIVQKGTLRVGDTFVAGVHCGKVRAMHDERGNRMDIAGPSTPVRVVGFDGLPEAGDVFFCVSNEVEARDISNERKQLKREQELRQVRHITLDEISAQIKIGGVQDLNLIIKGDVGGSVEAISDSLLKLSTDEVRVNILHKGVGAIIESDVMLAAASKAVIIGFNVSPTGAARRIADNEKIDIRLYSIIYDCINEVQLALEGLLKPDIKEEITSEVEVRRVFKISRLGAIAGCYVLSGKITRNDRVRLLRNGLPIFTGTIASLKRNKDDVKEVDTSYECGIQLVGFNDFEESDIIQGFKLVEIRRTLN